MTQLDVVGIGDIASMTGVNRITISMWQRRGHLPPPDATPSCGPVWWRSTIERWMLGTGRTRVGRVTNETITPKDLAAELGIDPKRLRDWLRATHPRALEAKHTTWAIDRATADEARAYFEPGVLAVPDQAWRART